MYPVSHKQGKHPSECPLISKLLQLIPNWGHSAPEVIRGLVQQRRKGFDAMSHVLDWGSVSRNTDLSCSRNYISFIPVLNLLSLGIELHLIMCRLHQSLDNRGRVLFEESRHDRFSGGHHRSGCRDRLPLSGSTA